MSGQVSRGLAPEAGEGRASPPPCFPNGRFCSEVILWDEWPGQEWSHGGGGEKGYGVSGSNSRVIVCVTRSAYPHTLSGNLWAQLPMQVMALALITPRKLLCVQTQFAVTQLWL